MTNKLCLQNTAARIATRTAQYTDITSVLKKLHRLPVKYRTQYKCLVYTYKTLHDQPPVYLLQVNAAPGMTLISDYTPNLVVSNIQTIPQWLQLPCATL
jgi:hypothetical protein